jgi:hypothetical protein
MRTVVRRRRVALVVDVRVHQAMMAGGPECGFRSCISTLIPRLCFLNLNDVSMRL